MSRTHLPFGTLTFLFTDIEGSTDLLNRVGGDRYRRLLEDHARMVRTAVGQTEGIEVNTHGDAFFVVFQTASQAVAAALAAQRALSGHGWPEDAPVRVRMGIHTGEAYPGGDDYVGLDVHRAARIAAAAHGGQVLVSGAAQALVHQALPAGVALRPLGEHRLRDLARPEPLYQLVAPGLPGQFPPPRTLDATPNNLPVQLSSFVGRGRELREAARLLGSVRLLTLTGPGGTGKTRLAMQVAAEQAERFPGGIYFVPLAELTEGDSLLGAVSKALGLPQAPGGDWLEQLRDAIGERKLLLVLDNLEQVAGMVSVLGTLLRQAPNLQILATSRVPLHLEGEQEYAVAPLDLPPTGPGVTPEAILSSEAGALFAERARAVRPGFSVSAENAAEVGEILARMDGLPLALELAAARVKLLPPKAILARLQGSLDLLAGGPRDRPARQQTLRAAIGWSYELLDDPARRLFRRLSVFAGGHELAEAEAVCGPPQELGTDVLEGLSMLVDQSLLRQVAYQGEPRFEMLQTIREFAWQRLEESGEAKEMSRRHAAVFLELAEAAAPALEGPEQVMWLARLEREHPNLRSALLGLLQRGEAEEALRLGAALWRFWFLHRHYREGRGLLAHALAESGGRRSSARGEALVGAAALAAFDGDREEAATLATEAMHIFDDAGQLPGRAAATWVLGVALLDREADRAGSLFAESLRLSQEAGDRRGEAWAHYWLGNLARRRGSYAEAQERFERCLEVLRPVGDPLATAWCLEQLGDLAGYAGDHEPAVSLYEESLAVFREAGDRDGVARSLNGLGSVARLQGDFRRAVDLHRQALTIRRELGIRRSVIFTLIPLGVASRLSGDLEGAREALGEAHSLAAETGDDYGLASVLEAQAALGIDLGELEQAARLFGAAEGLREELGVPLRPASRLEHEREVARLRQSLGDEDLEREWSAGRGVDSMGAGSWSSPPGPRG